MEIAKFNTFWFLFFGTEQEMLNSDLQRYIYLGLSRRLLFKIPRTCEETSCSFCTWLEFWHYPHMLLLPQKSNAYKSNIITWWHKGVTTWNQLSQVQTPIQDMHTQYKLLFAWCLGAQLHSFWSAEEIHNSYGAIPHDPIVLVLASHTQAWLFYCLSLTLWCKPRLQWEKMRCCSDKSTKKAGRT